MRRPNGFTWIYYPTDYLHITIMTYPLSTHFMNSTQLVHFSAIWDNLNPAASYTNPFSVVWVPWDFCQRVNERLDRRGRSGLAQIVAARPDDMQCPALTGDSYASPAPTNQLWVGSACWECVYITQLWALLFPWRRDMEWMNKGKDWVVMNC